MALEKVYYVAAECITWLVSGHNCLIVFVYMGLFR